MAWGLKKRSPDLVIGPKEDPYLLRWHILPRNKWFGVYLHHMLKSDYDRALHDHPYANISVVLKGGYLEHVPGQTFGGQPLNLPSQPKNAFWRRAGSVVFRGPGFPHRLELPPGRDSWSLFITFPRVREWGFWCDKGWVSHQEMVKTVDGVSITQNCPD